jgi:hypothetical protein
MNLAPAARSINEDPTDDDGNSLTGAAGGRVVTPGVNPGFLSTWLGE